MKKNLLVTTLGTSVAIIPELVGLTNYESFSLYHNSPIKEEIKELRSANNIEKVEEIWIITTAGTRDKDLLIDWSYKIVDAPKIKIWYLDGVEELRTSKECQQMADLTFRVVLHARKEVAGGKLYLSLAGGRKTMSADMQEAAHLFGCDALLHVASGDPKNFPKTEDVFAGKVDDKNIGEINPIVINGKMPKSPLLLAGKSITTDDYILEKNAEVNILMPSIELYIELKNRIKNARNLLCNYATHLSSDHSQTGFRALYALPPDLISSLHNQSIGIDGAKQVDDLKWLRSLPKAELHCHLGGVLSTQDMIDVAVAHFEDGNDFRIFQTDELLVWLNEIKHIISLNDVCALRKAVGSIKELRSRFKGVKEPVTVVSFLMLFKEHSSLLDAFIFGDYTVAENFKSVGIDAYEKLGDLQGSGLMQSEIAIRKVCDILKKQAIQNNIRYFELRCSPINYSRGDLTSDDVVSILLEELSNTKECYFMFIFIASRHGSEDLIFKHIKLAKKWIDISESFKKHFAGFDVAGAEHTKQPVELREAFMPLLQRCIHTTIHAGEDESVDNIWQAVYHLNADRIGHGLTLADNKNLMQRFVDRKISIEMCPSSNFQIVGYKDSAFVETVDMTEYPLKTFLNSGLGVTINTDDPGISRTNLTYEFYKAALMSEGGLTKWEILQLIRNGFRFAFCDYQTRQDLLLEAEKSVIDILQREYNELG